MSAPKRFTGIITSENWERFQHYARRIRRLDHNDSPSYILKSVPYSVQPIFLPALVVPEPLRGNPLLPNVLAIHWSATEEIDNLPQVLPFVASSLKSLTLDLYAEGTTDEHDSVICRFFDTLTGLGELQLESFKIERPGLGPEILDHFLPFLKHQQSLKDFGAVIEPYDEPGTTQGRLFPNLPDRLQELYVSVEFDGSSDYTALIQTILQRLSNLRALRLVLSSLGSWDVSDLAGLSPFLQYANLEELTLWVSRRIHLNKGDIYTLGRALPKLARLNLRRHYSVLPAIEMPASSLIDFAKAFPNLQTLEFHITSIDISLPSTSPNDETQVTTFNRSTFRLLDIGESPLAEKEVPIIAGFLGMLCQHPLFELKYSREDTGDNQAPQAWKKAEALIKQASFAAVSSHWEPSK